MPARASEVERLRRLLLDPAPGLAILDLNGPGGIGKSWLVQAVLREVPPDARLLVGMVDAARQASRGDLLGLLDTLFPARLPGVPVPTFPRVRRLLEAANGVVGAADAEIAAMSLPEDLRDTVRTLLRLGRVTNRALPITNAWLNVAALDALIDVEARVEDAWRLGRSLTAMRESGVIDRWFGGARRVRDDLDGALADAIVEDLAALLRPRRTLRAFVRQETEPAWCTRAVLVIDDFEATASALQELLVGALVPRLAAAGLPVTLLIVGRDSLLSMHPGWSQHAGRHLRQSLRLEPLGPEEAKALMDEAGVAPERQAALWKVAGGYPLLLSLLADPAAAGESAMFLRRFYDRTTRWMSPRERGWYDRVCYLDQIDADTLTRLFAPDEVAAVQTWFEREPSARDPDAPVFVVRPALRERTLRYLAIRHPSLHAERLAAAAP